MFFLDTKALKLFNIVFLPYVLLFIVWYFIFDNFSQSDDSRLLPILLYVSMALSMFLYFSWQFHTFKYFVRFSRISHLLRRLFGMAIFINGIIYFFISIGALIAISPSQGIDYYSVAPFIKDVSILLMILSSFLLGKALVTAEQRQVANVSEYFVTACLILMFPVGVWVIQPRIRKIVKENRSNSG